MQRLLQRNMNFDRFHLQIANFLELSTFNQVPYQIRDLIIHHPSIRQIPGICIWVSKLVRPQYSLNYIYIYYIFIYVYIIYSYIYIHIFIYINYYLPRSPTKISRAMLGAATQGSCTKSQVGFPFGVQERYETHGKYSWKIGKSVQKVCANQEIIFQVGLCLGMVGIPTRMPWSLKSLKSRLLKLQGLAFQSSWKPLEWAKSHRKMKDLTDPKDLRPTSAGRWCPVLGIGLVGIPTFKHGHSRSNRCQKPWEFCAQKDPPGNLPVSECSWI